jgi:hypothetical protein
MSNSPDIFSAEDFDIFTACQDFRGGQWVFLDSRIIKDNLSSQIDIIRESEITVACCADLIR